MFHLGTTIRAIKTRPPMDYYPAVNIMASCSQASFSALQAYKSGTVWNYASARPTTSYNYILRKECIFLLASAKVFPKTRVSDPVCQRSFPVTTASLAASSQIASSVFTLGTALVIPFYTLMVFAPHTELTKRSMESSIPYIVLGAMYTYLLGISWTSETLRLMFASKYWLPELPGITRMFSSDLTVASAWLHLLAVDLFAARQVFRDGLKDGIETRHSIMLCLLFCPIGIMSHLVTKVIAHMWRTSRGDRETPESAPTICGK